MCSVQAAPALWYQGSGGSTKPVSILVLSVSDCWFWKNHLMYLDFVTYYTMKITHDLLFSYIYGQM